MNKVFKRITALALAGVTVAAMGSGAAAEALQSAPEPKKLEVYCPTNDDPEFPFYMDIDVYEDTIQYIELDEPIYGLDRLLDEEALEFDVNFSLKDEYKSFDNYTFTVYNSDYSEAIASEHLESDGMVNLTGLSTGSGYKISIILESDSLDAYYGGQFVIQAELDGTLAVDLFYMLAKMDGEAAPFAYERWEDDERNNNLNTPDTITNLGMNAYTKAGDVDYFMYNIPAWMSDDGEEEFERGVATLTLSVTAGGSSIPDFTVEFIDSCGNPIRSVTSDFSLREVKYYRIPNISLNDSILIKVTSSNDIYAKYTLYPDVEFGHAWFSQYVSKEDDVVYWNTDKLSTITHYDYINDVIYPVFLTKYKNPTAYNGDVFATACGVVSSAMIFRNLGVTMNGYDVRTGYDGVLQADPFTALLSNCGYDGTFLKTTNKFPNTPFPDKLERTKVCKQFGLSYMDLNNTDDASLRNALSKYGYVLLRFNDGEKYVQHFMVLVGLGSGSTFAEKAIVLDPYAITYAKGAGDGNGIKLSETNWYINNFVNGSNVFKFSDAGVFY